MISEGGAQKAHSGAHSQAGAREEVNARGNEALVRGIEHKQSFLKLGDSLKARLMIGAVM